MRLFSISLYISLAVFLASYAHAGMFDNVLNNGKNSPGGVINAIDKVIEKKESSPAKETAPVEVAEKTAAKPVKTYDPVLVKKIQTQLNQLGYGAGRPDGVYSNNTRRAIQDFERQQGLAASGEPTPILLTRLDQAVQAKPKSNPGTQAQVLAKSSEKKYAPSEPKKGNTKDLLNTKEGQIVYEKCVSKAQWSVQFDCECLAEMVVEQYLKQRPEEPFETFIDQYSAIVYDNGTCRNIAGTTRVEYTKCMHGDGFDFRGIPQEDYCDCYAETWARLFEEYEGKISQKRLSSIRMKARAHCRKSLVHKAK